MNGFRTTMIGLIFVLCVPAATADEGASPSLPESVFEQGKSLRIFVAKHSAYRPTTSGNVRRVAGAGFNVFGQRWNQLDVEKVRRISNLARKHGLFHAVWFRGSLRAPPDDPEKQIVWPNAETQPLYAPLTPELWDHLEKWMLTYARLSREYPLIGVMLDFENYAENKQGNLYSVSYDVYSMRKFAEAAGLEAPPEGLQPEEAKHWFENQRERRSEWTKYREWFRNRFRTNWGKLRAKVDAINPRFLFMAYLTPGLTGEIMTEEVSTEQAPFVLAKPDYGRSPLALNESMALRSLKRRLEARVDYWASREGVNARVTGGPLPGYKRDDPEFVAKKLSLLAELGDGYWVWGANVHLKKDEEWYEWFSRANEDITSGEFSLHRKPRMTPEPAGSFEPDNPSFVQVAMEDDMRGGFREFVESKELDWEVHAFEQLDHDYMSNFDMIILQDWGVPQETRDLVHPVLREYVEAGRTLVLAHRTIRELGSPFPEVVAGGNEPVEEAPLRDRRVDHRRHRLTPHWDDAFAEAPRIDHFTAHYRPHVPLKPGPEGRVLLENRFGQPTLVVGTHGKGTVIFTGLHLGRRTAPNKDEGKVFLKVFDWALNRSSGTRD